MKAVKVKLLAGATTGVAVVAMAAWAMDAPSNTVGGQAKLSPWSGSAGEQVSRSEQRAEGCALASGERVSFDLSVEDTATLDMSGMAGGAPKDTAKISQRVAVKADLRALDASGDGALLVGAFRDIQARGLERPEELTRPFMLRLSKRCMIEGYAHHVDTPLPYARVQQSLLHELQWRWPVDGAERFEGSNSVGRFDAVARMSEHQGEPVIERSVKSYEPWQPGNHTVTSVEQSTLTVTPGEAAWFEKLSTNERLRSSRGVHERSVIAQAIDAVPGALDDSSTDESAYVWTDLLPQAIELPRPPQETPRQRRQRAVARTQTLAEAVDAYVARVHDDKVGIQESWPGLRAYLEVNPEAAEVMVEKLQSREIPKEAAMGVYMALGNARTDEARTALRSVLDDDTAPVFERSRAMLSLIDRADVGPELARDLSGWASDIATGKNRAKRVLARQSMLALGAMSGRHPDDVQLKEIALARIAQSLDALTHPLHLRPVYGAIANIGDPALLSLVEDVPSHPDTDRREYAAIVVRRMPAAQTGDFAARWLAMETHPRVKRELYLTIERQGHDAQEAASTPVLRIALEDLEARPSAMTRKALYRLLGRALQHDPKDPLGIEDTMLEMIPYEVEQKSGMYSLIAEYVDAQKQAKVRNSVAGPRASRPAAGPQPTPYAPGGSTTGTTHTTELP